jgi:hypothetical protein
VRQRAAARACRCGSPKAEAETETPMLEAGGGSSARESLAGSASPRSTKRANIGIVSAIKPYEGFGDVDHTIKELMSL